MLGNGRGVYKLLKVWRNQKFFKSFLWYINMKAKHVRQVRDERWELKEIWVGSVEKRERERERGREREQHRKKKTLLSLKLTCGLSAAVAVATLTPAGRQSIFCSSPHVVVAVVVAGVVALSNLALARCIINICRSKSEAYFCASYLKFYTTAAASFCANYLATRTQRVVMPNCNYNCQLASHTPCPIPHPAHFNSAVPSPRPT